jgi:hypothetical protein
VYFLVTKLIDRGVYFKSVCTSPPGGPEGLAARRGVGVLRCRADHWSARCAGVQDGRSWKSWVSVRTTVLGLWSTGAKAWREVDAKKDSMYHCLAPEIASGPSRTFIQDDKIT